MNSEIIDFTLPCEGVAFTNLAYETLNEYIKKYCFNFSVNAICLSGRITVLINTTEYELVENDMLTLFVGAVMEIKQVSFDALLAVACFAPEIVNIVNPLKVAGDMFHIIVDRPVLSMKSQSALLYRDYFSLLERADGSLSSTEFAVSVYNAILVATCVEYKSHTLKKKTTTRKEEICATLLELVTKNYVTQRRAQFYADELGISLQHLSTTVKTVTGKNVLDIIAYVVIMDAKGKLKNTNMTIQEIAYALNFPSASFFGKYFRRYVNLTPLEYRKR